MNDKTYAKINSDSQKGSCPEQVNKIIPLVIVLVIVGSGVGAYYLSGQGAAQNSTSTVSSQSSSQDLTITNSLISQSSGSYYSSNT
ncbi:MAG: hypothetical protein ACYCPP_09305, partial [Nitrososphaerales archaeon]